MELDKVKTVLKQVISLLDDKDAKDIKIIDMKDSSLIVDYFVICTADSDTLMSALRDYVLKIFKDNKIDLITYDKGKNYDWMIIDAGSIVVHFFTKEGREFYDLEGLWSEFDRIEV